MEFSKKDSEILRLRNLQKNEEAFFHEGDEVTVVAHEIEEGCAAQFTAGKVRYKFRLSNGKEIVIVASWPCDALASDTTHLFQDDELIFPDGHGDRESGIAAVGIFAASRLRPEAGHGQL